MKLAYWYPEGTFSAWSISRGAVNALGRMGHEVRACGIDPKAGTVFQDEYPTTVEIRSFDGIIVSGPEHIGRVIRGIYPDWEQISVPKAAWLHETVRREDYGELNLDPIKRLADTIFCPAVQDEEFGFRFLPFGVDMDVFRPEPVVSREIDVGFIGLMYPKRQQYLDQIVLPQSELEERSNRVSLNPMEVHYEQAASAFRGHREGRHSQEASRRQGAHFQSLR